MMCRPTHASWIVVLAIVSSAHAQERDPMADGIAAYEALDYERAVERLSVALARATRDDERIVIVRALAFSHVALEQLDAARADFQMLLRLEPAMVLDRAVSPRVRTVFEEAKAELAPAPPRAPPPLVVALAPPRPKSGQAIALSLPAVGLTSVELYHRTRGAAGFARASATPRDGRVDFAVPGPDVRSPALEYYLVALDERGAPASYSGTAERPLFVDVEPDAPRAARHRRYYQRAWFWIVVAGAAATVAITAGVAATAGSSDAHVVINRP
jgi:hypothetical protein